MCLYAALQLLKSFSIYLRCLSCLCGVSLTCHFHFSLNITFLLNTTSMTVHISKCWLSHLKHQQMTDSHHHGTQPKYIWRLTRNQPLTLQSLVPHLSCKRLMTKASTGLVRAPPPSPLSPQAVTVNVCDFRRVPVVTLLCTFPEGALRQDSCVHVLRQRTQLNFHRHRLPKTK